MTDIEIIKNAVVDSKGKILSAHKNKWNTIYVNCLINDIEIQIRNSDHESFNDLGDIDIIGGVNFENVKERINLVLKNKKEIEKIYAKIRKENKIKRQIQKEKEIRCKKEWLKSENGKAWLVKKIEKDNKNKEMELNK